MPSTQWVHVANVDDCPIGEGREFIAAGRVVALFHLDDGGFAALDGVCPHQGGPLGKGSLCGETVTCPWHGWQFNARTGQHLANASLRQETLPVRLEGERLLVELPVESEAGDAESCPPETGSPRG